MNQAEQHIGFIDSFMEYPDDLCEEDWEDWRPRIARACCAVNEELRK